MRSGLIEQHFVEEKFPVQSICLRRIRSVMLGSRKTVLLSEWELVLFGCDAPEQLFKLDTGFLRAIISSLIEGFLLQQQCQFYRRL